jgi:polyhydroxybutyrate depolymerase
MHRLVPLPGRRTTRRLLVTAIAATALAPAQAGAQAPPTCATQGTTGTAYAQGVNCRTVKLDGHPRRFLVYVPAAAPPAGERRPVVFMFHGSGGDGEKFLRMSGWREQADATGLIAVFPTGLRYRVLESGRLETKWNDFNLAGQINTSELPPGSDPGSSVPADDVSFVDTMVADLRAQLPIDGHRVYASGFSNGAGFAARLSVDRADKIAAVAYSGGGLPEAQTPPTRPVPTFITAGTLDDRIIEKVDPTLPELPLDPVGILTNPGLSGFFGNYHSTFGLDAGLYGAIAAPHATTLRWPATGSGPNGAVLKFAMLDDLTHQFPNGTNNPNGFAAAPEYWEFLRNYRAP